MAADGDNVLVTRSLSIAATGRLDLKANSMVVDHDLVPPLVDIDTWVATGYAGGAWNGNGITSSTAAAGAGRTGLAVAASTELFSSFPATFGGESIDSTSVLVQYTQYADANVDGLVNLTDFNLLAGNFGQSNRRWSRGDFTYDGTVNLADFNRLAGNFGQGLSPSISRASPRSIVDDDDRWDQALPDGDAKASGSRAVS